MQNVQMQRLATDQNELLCQFPEKFHQFLLICLLWATDQFD